MFHNIFRYKKRLLITGCLLLMAIYIANFTGILNESGVNAKTVPAAENGVIDLAGWSMEQDGFIKLNGSWDFYWEKLLSYHDLAGGTFKSDTSANVPEVWNNYLVEGRRLPGFGYATYRLKVKNVNQNSPIALRMSTVSTAYRMYINDKLIASNGVVGTAKEDFKPEYKPLTVSFTPPSDTFDVIVQVSNFSYARGGIWYVIHMGTPEQVQSLDETIIYKDLFLLGSLLIMALYYFSIFLMRREDKSSLYFVLLCLVAMGRTMIYGDYSINKFFPGIPFEIIVFIDYITLYWFPTVFLLLITELFPRQTSKKSVRIFIIYSISMSLLTAITPVYFYTRLTYFVEIVILVSMLYIGIYTFAAYLRKESGALIVLIGEITLIIGGTHDILYQNDIIYSSFGEMTPLAVFIMLFLQSFILAERFALAFKNINELTQRLIRVDSLKDEFLANTSHELRTPLNGIIGIAEAMLREKEDNLNEGQKQNLSIVISSGRRLANLVNDILDYSKLKHNDIKLNMKPIQLNNIIPMVLEVIRHSSSAKKVEILCDLPDGLPPVMADENRLIQILFNLMGNAVKFTACGYVKVSARTEGEAVRVCVEDTGEGIPESMLEEVFKSFEQVDTSLTRKYGGTGLGLSIAKQLVEAMEGKIWVESELDRGSRFFFTLLGTAEAAQVEEYEMFAADLTAASLDNDIMDKPLRISQEGARILLVDDEYVNLHSTFTILKLEGYSVTAVDNGAAALDEIRQDPAISLVVLDVMMPEMSGFEVCKKIRDNKSAFDLPVLILTARNTLEDIVLNFEAGANDYLSKPYEAEELLARVRTLVEIKKSVDRALQAELQFLQSQIRPHFIYNALNTIASISYQDTDRARKILVEFSHYLRSCFDFRKLDDTMPLERELEFVRSYVAIEQARFGERLKVEYDVDDIGMQMHLPPLILQPLVENAIIHGLRPRSEGGTVRVYVKQGVDKIIVGVEDNGVGIPAEKLAVLFDEDGGGRGVGLYNVNQRLKKLYGTSIHILAVDGGGTDIYIEIPR